MDPVIQFLIPVWLFVLLGGVTILLYQVPIRIVITGRWNETIREGHTSIGWGPCNLCIIPGMSTSRIYLRILKARIYSFEIGGHGSDNKNSADPRPEQETHPRTLKGLLPAMKKILSLLVSHITIRKIQGTISFGAGDPVTTGILYGFYQALYPLVMNRCAIILVPVFDHLLLEGELDATILIIHPFRLLIKGTAIVLPAFLIHKEPESPSQGGIFA